MQRHDPAVVPDDEDPEFASFVTAYEEALVTGAPLPDDTRLSQRQRQDWQRIRPVLHLLHQANRSDLPGAPVDAARTTPTVFHGPTRVRGADNPAGRLPTVPGYEVLAEVGRGGMGVVYQARHQGLKRLVALKMILAGELATPEQRLRFQIEAEMAARVRHPNVVVVHEVGCWQERPFLAMEWVEGGTLSQKLAGGPLPFHEAARLLETLARAAHAAHCQGVVHRDLKPANVLLRSDGQPLLTDFGLARVTARGEATELPRLTVPGTIVGTPEYMAPEQAAGDRQIGPAVDIYALGAILYECLTGRPPFHEVNFLRTVLRAQLGEPPPPHLFVSGLPADLETICLHCLRKEPEKRYPTAEALAEDLRRFQAAEPITARPVGELERARLWAKRHPAVAWLLVVVAGLLIGGTVLSSYFAWQSSQSALTAQQHQQQAEEEKQEAELARDAAWESEQRARMTMADLFVAQGLQADKRGEERQAALWFAEAIRKSEGHPQRMELNRLRALAWSRRVSRPVAALPCDLFSIGALTFHPSNRYLLASPASPLKQSLTLWDVVEERPVNLPAALGKVTAAVWSRDGTALATGAADGRLCVSGFPAWTVLQTASTSAPVTHLRFSPDGRRVAVVSGATLRVWDRAQATFLGEPVTSDDPVTALEFSPDGQHLAVGLGRGAFRVVRPGAQLEVTWVGEPAPAEQADLPAMLLFSPDSRWLVTHDRVGRVTCWDVARRRAVHTLQHPSNLHHCAVSPDGRYLAVAWSQEVVLYALGSGATVHRWRQATPLRMCRWLHFSPDSGRLLGASFAGMLHWSTATGQPMAEPAPAYPGQRVVCCSPDGQCVAVASNRWVRVWVMPQPPEGDFRIPGGDLPAQGVFSPDGRELLVCQIGGVTRVWRLDEQVPAGPPLQPTGSLRSAGFARGGTLVVTHSQILGAHNVPLGHQLDGWDWRNGRRVFPTLALGGAPVDLADHAETGRLALATGNGLLVVVDTKTGRVIWRTEAAGVNPTLLFSPDGSRLVVAREKPGGLTAYEAGTGKVIYTRECGPRTGITRWARSAGTQRLAWIDGDQKHLCLVDAATGNPVGSPQHLPSTSFPMEMSPDGRLVVTHTTDRLLRVWDTIRGQAAGVPLELPEGGLLNRLTPDGRWIVSASLEGRLDLWDWRLGQRLLPGRQTGLSNLVLIGPGGPIHVSPDGRWACLGGKPHLEVIRLPEVPSAEGGSVDDLCTGAELLSFRRIQEGGTLALLTTEEWMARWQTQQRTPLDGVTPEQLLAPASATATLLAQGLAAEAVRRLDAERAGRRDGVMLRQLAQACRSAAEELRLQGRVQEARPYQERASQAYQALRDLRPDDALHAGELGDYLLEATGTGWRLLDPVELRSQGGATLTRQADGSVLASGPNPERDTYRVVARPGLPGLLALRLEALPDPSLPGNGPGRRFSSPSNLAKHNQGTFLLQRLQVLAASSGASQPAEVPLQEVTVNYSEAQLPRGLSGDPQGVLGRSAGVWSIYPQVGQPHRLLATASRPFGAGPDATVTVLLAFAELSAGQNLGRFRLAVTDNPQTVAAERWRLLLAESAVNGWGRLGVAYCVRGEWAKARAALDRGAALAPDDETIGWMLALTHTRLGNRDEARTHRERGLTAFRKSPASALVRQAAREAMTDADPRDAAAFATLLRDSEQEPELARLNAAVAAGPGQAAPLAARGFWLGRHSRWKESARDLVEACQHEPGNHYHWFLAAVLLASLDDEPVYSRHRAEMLRRFGDSRDGVIAERIAKVALLAPAKGDDLKRAVALAERAKIASGLSVPVTLAVALAELRQGHVDAARTLARSAGAQGNPGTYFAVTALAIEALALAEQGKPEASEAVLAKAESQMAGWPGVRRDDLGPAWADLLVGRILVREAAARLGARPGE
ncbi:MAG: protein kinase [Gemmataceae bacterium]